MAARLGRHSCQGLRDDYGAKVASDDIAELVSAVKLAELQLALDQAAELQAAELHAAELHAAELQLASDWTALDQAAASNVSEPVVGSGATKALKPSFGLGGVKSRLAAVAASTSPTPADTPSALGR